MATVTIAERGCRGCTMCADVCPVEVFEFDDAKGLALVSCEEDCIGCLSCRYVCPSGCIEVGDVEMLRPFHRIEAHAALIERFLQRDSTTTSLSAEDLAEAHADVSARLIALADTVVETMGRGHQAVGRRAGAVAAAHLPEVYDESGLDGVLSGMQRLFGAAFDFDYQINDDQIEMEFHPCGICRVVREAGETVGEAVLCQMFHKYWAGLITTYLGENYLVTVPRAGETCEMVISPMMR